MDSINDPAWFYSSLAQTAAAIVGLIGAVLGSRIIEHVVWLRTERQPVDHRVAGTFNAIQEAAITLKGLCEWFRTEIAQDEKTLAAGQPVRRISSWRTWGSHRSGGDDLPVAKHKSEMESYLKVVEQIMPAYSSLGGRIDLQETKNYAERLLRCADAIPSDFHDREKVVNQIRSHAQCLADTPPVISAFREKLLPASFKFMFVILVWLALTGVLWPLLALPGLAGSYPKSLMLVSLALGILGLIGFFGYQFVELLRLGRFTWKP